MYAVEMLLLVFAIFQQEYYCVATHLNANLAAAGVNVQRIIREDYDGNADAFFLEEKRKQDTQSPKKKRNRSQDQEREHSTHKRARARARARR